RLGRRAPRSRTRRMSTEEGAAEVVRRHVDAVRQWQMPDMIIDYAEDAVLITRGVTIRSKAAIKELFERAEPHTGIFIESETYDGPIGLVVYRSDQLRFASDAFVVRAGKIAYQTVSTLAAGID